MPRRLLALNVFLGVIALSFVALAARELLVRRPLPAAPAARPAAAAAAAAQRDAAKSDEPPAYGAIVAKYLFNPARTEGGAMTAASPATKPLLHGVVVDGEKSRAYLTDPASKRVFGYAVGDSVAGGRLERIAEDRVVIARPEGPLEVLLRDPAKPGPSPTAAAAAAPAQPQTVRRLSPPQPLGAESNANR
jgi:hypothetical protein